MSRNPTKCPRVEHLVLVKFRPRTSLTENNFQHLKSVLKDFHTKKVLAQQIVVVLEEGGLEDEEERLELELALHGEVFHEEMLLPVVRQQLVELAWGKEG